MLCKYTFFQVTAPRKRSHSTEYHWEHTLSPDFVHGLDQERKKSFKPISRSDHFQQTWLYIKKFKNITPCPYWFTILGNKEYF